MRIIPPHRGGLFRSLLLITLIGTLVAAEWNATQIALQTAGSAAFTTVEKETDRSGKRRLQLLIVRRDAPFVAAPTHCYEAIVDAQGLQQVEVPELNLEVELSYGEGSVLLEGLKLARATRRGFLGRMSSEHIIDAIESPMIFGDSRPFRRFLGGLSDQGLCFNLLRREPGCVDVYARTLFSSDVLGTATLSDVAAAVFKVSVARGSEVRSRGPDDSPNDPVAAMFAAANVIGLLVILFVVAIAFGHQVSLLRFCTVTVFAAFLSIWAASFLRHSHLVGCLDADAGPARVRAAAELAQIEFHPTGSASHLHRLFEQEPDADARAALTLALSSSPARLFEQPDVRELLELAGQDSSEQVRAAARRVHIAREPYREQHRVRIEGEEEH